MFNKESIFNGAIGEFSLELADYGFGKTMSGQLVQF
jgi:hypothetical protein